MMSFWVGVVLIVLSLEAVRIGISSYLLLHILRAVEREAEGGQPAYPAAWHHERDRLAANAMDAMRQTMDGLAHSSPRQDSRATVEALDAYIMHLQDRPER